SAFKRTRRCLCQRRPSKLSIESFDTRRIVCARDNNSSGARKPTCVGSYCSCSLLSLPCCKGTIGTDRHKIETYEGKMLDAHLRADAGANWTEGPSIDRRQQRCLFNDHVGSCVEA